MRYRCTTCRDAGRVYEYGRLPGDPEYYITCLDCFDRAAAKTARDTADALEADARKYADNNMVKPEWLEAL